MRVLTAALNDRFISITGPDTLKFLQGQASCDLSTLSTDNFTFGTLNTPKGRMYCLFKAVMIENGLLLSMDESLLASTLKTLNKYAVFFKCELKEASQVKAFGFTADDEAAYTELLNRLALPLTSLSASRKNSQKDNHETEQHIQHHIWLNVSAKHKIGEYWTEDSSSLPTAFSNDAVSIDSASYAPSIDQDHWHILETQAGIPALYDSSQEEFILQYINLHLLGAVSFKKGCYTGQEIIARMKFLGKQKKQSYLLHSNELIPSSPLSSVYDPSGKKCGTIIRAHTDKSLGTYALAILPIEHALNYSNVYLDEHMSNAFSVSEIDYNEFKK